MSAITDFLVKHKISIGMVGTTIVVATAYGSCQITPELPEEAPVEEAPVEEEEPGEPVEEEPGEPTEKLQSRS